MSETAAAAACNPVLPEDVISEILVRVTDLVSLFRCSVVCKRWRGLIADPAFLRRRRLLPAPAGAQPSLLGFFVQRNWISADSRRKISKLFPTRAPAFVPAPGSLLGPERRFLTSFVRDDAGLLDDAKPLAARGGLLLARVSPRPTDKNSVLRLCVCNLLTGRHDLLAPLDAVFFDDEGVRGYALLTAADHGAGRHPPADGYSTFFQVLLVGVAREERHLHLLRFSSAATRSQIWSARNCRLQTRIYLWGPYGCCVAAVARGTAHWLFRGNDPAAPSLYTLNVGARTGCISATMLPFHLLDLSNACLSTSMEGRLSLHYAVKNRLVILKQQDGDQVGTLVWRFSHIFHVGIEPGLLGIESLSSVCVGEKSGTMLALYHSDPGCAYTLGLQSGSAATKVEGWTRSFNYMTAVPYEINWPMFFMSRLGIQI